MTDTHLHMGLEGASRKPQASQPDLSAGVGYGTDHLECHHAAHTGQPGDQTQPTWD